MPEALLCPPPPLINGRSFIDLREGLRLSFVEAGSGPSLLLIPGLGRGCDMFARQLRSFARRFRVLAPDNRGAGQSDAPAGPYSIACLADDLAELLRARRVSQTHVMGVSLGGFVAIELAVRYPELLSKLVLVSTSAGGPASTPMDSATWQAVVSPLGRSAPERVLNAMRLAYHRSYARDNFRRLAAIARRRTDRPAKPHAWLAQAQAGAAFDRSADIPGIRAACLVLTGLEDRIVPAANARWLARQLPDARLRTFARAGHYLCVERARALNAAVHRFLSEPPKRTTR